MISILDTIDIYLSKNYNERIRDYKCNEGNILYFNDKRNDHIVIHTIYLYEEYRRKGIFTNLINKIINNYKEIKYICVICPSLPLSTYLMANKFDDRYFRNLYTGEFIWVRNHILLFIIMVKMMFIMIMKNQLELQKNYPI